jgi:flavorubredoxin
MLRLADDVYITSVLNPSMRIFDVTMETEFGTSYNSYVVKGASKIALIDAAKDSFTEYYLRNLVEVLAGTTPDYLVLNHCELDHTGCVHALLDRWPELEIVVSQAGTIYMKNILNRGDYTVRTVREGDTLDLGGLTLQFKIAPFLHWPDSMFTWLPERNVLFTCDFLGTHFCEPQWFDYNVLDHADYEGAVKGYFDAIFGPFPAYVLKGLDRVAETGAETVATSHGPILTRGCHLQAVMDSYRQWATPEQREHPVIPVFYTSAYGNTERIAKAIAEGIGEGLPAAEVPCYDIIEHDLDELSAQLNECDAFAIGSTTINRDAVPPAWHLLANIEAVGIAKRPCIVFGSFGWSGEAAPHLADRLTSLKANVYGEPLRICFVPTEEDLRAARAFGKEFAASL